MAHIEKRGENTYRISVSDGYDRDGKKIVLRKTVKLKPEMTERQQKKETERLAILFEEEIKRNNYSDENITFERFTRKWLTEYAEKNLEPKTVHSYKMELSSKILPAIGRIRLKKLKPLHLARFLNNLTHESVRADGKKGGYSSRTIKYQLKIISSILQTAVFWQIVDQNIAKKVSPPKGARVERKDNFFDEIQSVAFLEYIKGQPIKYKALIHLTLFGGLRTEEVLALTWNDIDFDKASVDINKALSYVAGKTFIKDTKNQDSSRRITLPSNVMDLLKQLKSETSSVKVFDMNYYTPNHWLKKQIERYNKDNEIPLPKITFHGLRHTSATLLISQGLDVKTVSGRLGHADTTTTLNIYSHYIKSKDKAASDALDNLLNKNKSH